MSSQLQLSKTPPNPEPRLAETVKVDSEMLIARVDHKIASTSSLQAPVDSIWNDPSRFDVMDAVDPS